MAFIGTRFLLAAALTGAALASPTAARACGNEPYFGEICLFATSFCPSGYLPADGRSLKIESNAALFSLLGSRFGGDGKTTFNIPTIRPVPDANGQGALLSCIAVSGYYPPRD